MLQYNVITSYLRNSTELRHYQEANTQVLFHVGVIIRLLSVNDEPIEVV
jgi:hypothetical protein